MFTLLFTCRLVYIWIHTFVGLRLSFSEKMKLTLSLMRLSSKLAERLEKYGRYYPSPLTIQHIVEFGN